MNKMKLTIGILILLSALVLSADPNPRDKYFIANNLPILEYNYHTPSNHISPVAMSLGGVNITNGIDVFGGYDNPALLSKNKKLHFAISARRNSEEALSFDDMVEYSNLLKENQLSYVGISAKTFSFSYQTLSEVHISEGAGDNQEYYDYKLDAFQTSFALLDKKVPNGSIGFGVKYLFGRLVHLVTNETRDTFLDEKVKGFSIDAGGIYKVGRITFAGSLMDVYSKLYWEHFDSEELVRNWALGTQYDLQTLQVMYTMKGRIEEVVKTTNHIGVNFTPYSAGTEEDPQSMGLRGGTFWEYVIDEDGEEEKLVKYTMGIGYQMSGVKIDFGLVSPEFDWKANDYLISMSFSF